MLLNLLLPAFALLTSSTVAASSSVIDLIPSNFDSVVLKSGKPALVEFFAPWCGHCKNLAPVYEELASAFAYASDKVVIGKVDADEHKSLGKQFKVQGFPTLKWFDGKSDTPSEYSGGRDLESLSKWITDKTGLKPKVKGKGKVASSVVMLDDKSFEEKIGKDQDVLVAFTAPWCGHCKTLAPTWESLATDFVAEPTVLIAKVDAEAPNAKKTAGDQGVSSYPTIKFFPKGSTEAVPYEGGRNEKDFVAYINEKAGTHRAVGGGLDATGGTIEALDTIAEKFYGAYGDGLEEIKKAAQGLQDKYAEYYVKVFQKVDANKGYVEKELKRLEGLLKKGSLAPEKVDDLTSRSNILRRFLGKQEKSEL
ncbi:disulfide isomerase [Mytilinidion resinicola]|uniref:protein disulfide-isomerase n=1 Tax=Mytilinidion resinicola TaxID=574789 RepID=A0A6A6YER1_9PEZI|nr:disulfide isomerase [Mytilinidion resinicola]KAF2806494.1 disulfide isomerase [Mytilinidion resinicola]